jgi:hypothetical protein
LTVKFGYSAARAPLAYIRDNADVLRVITTAATRYAETTGQSGNQCVSANVSAADFTIASGATGPVLTVATKRNQLIKGNGVVTHIALTRASATSLLLLTTCSAQALVSGGGNLVDIASWTATNNQEGTLSELVQGKFMSTTGSDSNVGSEASPWRTLSASLPKLVPGDTLYIRGGTYTENGITVSNVNGTASQGIAVKNYPGETPIFDGGYTQFRSIGNSDWTLYDAATNTYRSSATFTPGGSSVQAKILINGTAVVLPTYNSLAALTSTTQTFQLAAYYTGPGVFWNSSDSRIYIRLEQLSAANVFNESVVWPENTDPRQNTIYIGQDTYWIQFSSTISSYLSFEGLSFNWHGRFMRIFNNSHHLTFKDLTCDTGVYFGILSGVPNNLTFDGIVSRHGLPRWLAWADAKLGSTFNVPSRSAFLEYAAAGITGVEVKNCRITGYFDGILPVNSGVSDLNIHNNDFIEIWDDTVQLAVTSSDVTFAYNFVYGPGVSHHGSGSAASPGTVYLHHNIIDCRHRVLWCKPDPGGIVSSGTGWRCMDPFPDHESGSGGGAWQMYNNTVLWGSRMTTGDAGIARFASTLEAVQRTINNIFYNTEDGSSGANGAFIVRGARVNDGFEIFDGNCYWQTQPGSQSLFEGFLRASGSASFASLASFIGSAAQNDTKSYYAVGWENSGTETNPAFTASIGSEVRSGFIPTASVLNGGVNLASLGLPGWDGPYRGAIAPSTDGSQIGRP